MSHAPKCSHLQIQSHILLCFARGHPLACSPHHPPRLPAYRNCNCCDWMLHIVAASRMINQRIVMMDIAIAPHVNLWEGKPLQKNWTHQSKATRVSTEILCRKSVNAIQTKQTDISAHHAMSSVTIKSSVNLYLIHAIFYSVFLRSPSRELNDSNQSRLYWLHAPVDR